MTNVKLNLNERKRGRFTIEGEAGQSGFMEIGLNDNALVVYHTEVTSQAEGKGFAKQLFDEMVAYAREHKLKVVPLCRYVHKQFERRPDYYRDLWSPSTRE
jgi:uncharacterized protein